MPKLGDFFSEDAQVLYIRSKLQSGQVLYLFCPFTNPPKEKYLALVCHGARPLLFVLNSELNSFRANRPEISTCQVVLRKAEYAFLDHDSYLDCSEVVDSFDESAIIRQLTGDLQRIKGTLNPATKVQIITVVKQAVTLNAVEKTAIIGALL